jgi:hypothetical protein
MKYKIIFLFLTIALTILSCEKECSEWYTNLELRGVTKKVNSTKSIKEWFETERMSNELNFWIVYIYSADAYEGCKSKTRINNTIKTDVLIFVPTDATTGTKLFVL